MYQIKKICDKFVFCFLLDSCLAITMDTFWFNEVVKVFALLTVESLVPGRQRTPRKLFNIWLMCLDKPSLEITNKRQASVKHLIADIHMYNILHGTAKRTEK